MADMSGNLPLATPYPWTPQELECYKSLSNVKKRKKWSGYAASHLSSPTMSTAAKSLLENLLRQHEDSDVETGKKPFLDKSILTNDTSESNDCLFVSLLRVISQGAPVSTRQLLRSCCGNVSPRHVPPHMDCKEYVMAGLFFLSSSADLTSDEFCKLPLIEAAPPQDDLEKRTYQKKGDWSLEDSVFVRKLKAIDRVFGLSGNEWNYLGRQYHLPLGIEGKDKETLLLKGALPKKDVNKKRKASAATKREETQTPPAASVDTSVDREMDSMASSFTNMDQDFPSIM